MMKNEPTEIIICSECAEPMIENRLGGLWNLHCANSNCKLFKVEFSND